MRAHQPIEPLMVTDLVLEVRQELLTILESLSDTQWTLPTVCEGWSVRDVALHILGDDIGLLSNMRDKDGQYHHFESWEGLVTFINQQNDVWVRATRRMSRNLLIHLLRDTGQQVHDLFKTIDPFALGGPIGWAGDQPDPMWLHMARELTEYWAHHQHICDAIGRTSLKAKRYLLPVLTTYVHALPRTLRHIQALEDTLVKFQVTAPIDTTWHIVRQNQSWVLYAGSDFAAAATVTLDAESAWRLFTRNKPIAALKPDILLSGDLSLGEALLETIAFIG